MDDIIIKYLNQTATEEEMKLLYAWLESDIDNQKYFAAIRDVWFTSEAALASLYGKNTNAFTTFKNRALAFESRKKQKNNKMFLFKIAASVVILISCSLVGFLMGKEYFPVKPQIVTVKTNQVLTGVGHKEKIILPDGSFAWLNSNSKLMYPDKFERNSRKVILDGEGYFEVKHDKNSPFYVETSNMSVKVLGTHFDVQCYSERDISEAILLSGKVEVQLKCNNDTHVLSPNEKLSFDKQNNKISLIKVDATDYALWTAEKLVFEDERLIDILKKIEHWYNIKISIQNNVPLNTRYSLTIRNESKEEILRMLSILAHFNYTINGNVINVFEK